LPRLTASRWWTPRALAACALGIGAFALVLAVTDPPGPGFDPDAMSYLGAAESLVRDGTLRVPSAGWDDPDSTTALEHFPPLYSVVIAAPVRLGMDPVQGARLVIALSAFATAVLVMLLMSDVAGPPAGALAVIALAVTPPAIDAHVSILSEPLFLALMAATLMLMWRRARQPWMAGSAAAAATLVRYAGASLPAACVAWAFGGRRDTSAGWRARLVRAVVAGAPAAIGMGAWVLVSRRARGAEGIRDVAIYSDLGRSFGQGARTIGAWAVPRLFDLPGGWVAAALAVALLALTWIAGARAIAGGQTGRWLGCCALVAGSYAAVLVASRALADPAIPFDGRILLPLLLLGELATVAAAAALWRTRGLATRLTIVAAAAAWCWGSLSIDRENLEYARQEGSDFAGWSWRNSALMEWTRADRGAHTIYTNWPSAVWFHTGRNAREVPQRYEARSLPEFGARIRGARGAVVMFNALAADALPLDALVRAGALRQIYSDSSGSIWVPAGPAPIVRSKSPGPAARTP
jgi:hypothetical protein